MERFACSRVVQDFVSRAYHASGVVIKNKGMELREETVRKKAAVMVKAIFCITGTWEGAVRPRRNGR